MARAKRDAKPFTMKMDTTTFERLEQYCRDSGQTKTIAVERAINAYIDDYFEQQKFLEKHTQYSEKNP